MLLLMALSAAIFLLRFSGAIYVGVVIVYFTALTIMLFTPLVSIPVMPFKFPLGGIRYFSLVAVLPFFHFVLDLIDPDAAKGKAKARVSPAWAANGDSCRGHAGARQRAAAGRGRRTGFVLAGLAAAARSSHFARGLRQGRSDCVCKRVHFGGDRNIGAARISDARTFWNSYLAPRDPKFGYKPRISVSRRE